MLPLSPGVRRSADAGQGDTKAPAKSVMEKTLRQDDHTCRFCGFQSRKYQRVIPYIVEGKQSLVTVCTFCEQTLMLERVGVTGAGFLIWLPEIAQAELNHIAHAIYVAKSEGGEVAEAATRALDALTQRRAEAKKRLGTDDPMLLATVLSEALEEREFAAAKGKLEGVRYLPADKHMVRGPKGDVNQFPAMVDYWRSPDGPYASLPPKTWFERFGKVA